MNEAGFWASVDTSAGLFECWPWLKPRNRYGYGKIWFQGRRDSASRAAWIIANGPIPAGLHVLHRCDNPPCCNPAHLFLGTNADNIRDRIAKGRFLGVGAKLSSEQADEIRRLNAAGTPKKVLARRYGVAPHTIRVLIQGRTWKSRLPARGMAADALPPVSPASVPLAGGRG